MRRKRASDVEYRQQDRENGRSWREAHRGYWKQWRRDHPDYEKRNREKQRMRNKIRRDALKEKKRHGSTGIANVDAWKSEEPEKMSTYRIEVTELRPIANVDASTSEGAGLIGVCRLTPRIANVDSIGRGVVMG